MYHTDTTGAVDYGDPFIRTDWNITYQFNGTRTFRYVIYPTLYNECKYSSTMESELIHVSKRGYMTTDDYYCHWSDHIYYAGLDPTPNIYKEISMIENKYETSSALQMWLVSDYLW